LNNRFKGNEVKKGFQYDRKKKFDHKKKYEERDPYDPSIYVRNGNVDQAIRTLKKKLLKDNFQKELAKREYYEKPTAKRKRQKAQGIKKHEKTFREKIMRGEALPPVRGGQKHLKGKRSLNKYRATKRLLQNREWASRKA
jgi:small subunit ribosomal protein S21|tara:strand:- start:639 stop:1058 length:420 start_codon:yes stop_codon:yes gene_type:complete